MIIYNLQCLIVISKAQKLFDVTGLGIIKFICNYKNIFNELNINNIIYLLKK